MNPVRKRMRLTGWNYSDEGTYFLTLCAKDRRALFSQIVGRGILDAPAVELSRYGKQVHASVEFIAEHNADLILHHCVIIPNHVHLLVSLKPDVSGGASGMPRPTNSIIAKMVSSLKRYTNRQCGTELWQNGYYDHIVRDEQDFLRCWQYIDNNPAAWLEDDYYID